MHPNYMLVDLFDSCITMACVYIMLIHEPLSFTDHTLSFYIYNYIMYVYTIIITLYKYSLADSPKVQRVKH